MTAGAGQEHRIAFGSESHPLMTPDGMDAAWILPTCPDAEASPEDIILRELGNPRGCARLSSLARGGRNAAVLIPGKDRVAGVEVFLPCLLDELNSGGIADDDVDVIVATGTHAAHSEADMKRLMGAAAFTRVRCRQHNCRPGEHLLRLGETRRGTPVEFDRLAVEADITILTGRIIPHYFAGFSGGRKALLPGVASLKTILHNHRLTLDSGSGIHPAARPCRLEGNPVHEDMMEAARLVKPTFVLNTLLDEQHRLVAAVAGEMQAAHAAGCEMAESWFSIAIDQSADAVVACAGGQPYDCDIVQALKAVFDVQSCVKPGGAILWVAECSMGMKENFLNWARIGDSDDLERAVREHYDLSGHNTIMLRRLLRKARVAFWSLLPDEVVRALGLQPVHSLEEGLQWLRDASPRGSRVTVVPFANITHVSAP